MYVGAEEVAELAHEMAGGNIFGGALVPPIGGSVLSDSQDKITSKEYRKQLGLLINAAEARGENFITLFRTASPAEAADIRATGVFRPGPSNFPKQFTLTYADAKAFQEALPELEGTSLKYSIFSARVSTRIATRLLPNTDSIPNHGTFLYLTAPTPAVLNSVNVRARKLGGIQELP